MDYHQLHRKLATALMGYQAHHSGQTPPDLVLRIHPNDYEMVLRTWPIEVLPPALDGNPKFEGCEVFVDPYRPEGKPVLHSRWSVEL